MYKLLITDYNNLMATKKQVDKYVDELRDWMAKRVKAIRLQKNLLQKDAAALAGMPPSRLAEIENATYHLSGPTFARLLVAYEMHPVDFFTGAPRPPQTKRKKENEED